MSEGAEWMDSGLVLERAGLGPRASLSAAVARNGPQAGQAEGRTARVPKQGGDTKDRPRLYTQPTSLRNPERGTSKSNPQKCSRFLLCLASCHTMRATHTHNAPHTSLMTHMYGFTARLDRQAAFLNACPTRCCAPPLRRVGAGSAQRGNGEPPPAKSAPLQRRFLWRRRQPSCQ